MILPVYGYGQKVLKQKCQNIEKEYPALNELIENMWETMYHAQGIGLAAPQIGRGIRLFFVDTEQIFKDEIESDETGIKQVFINAQKIEETGDQWEYEEGCLSIPNVRGNVLRPELITLEYFDLNFNKHQKTFDGITARVIQHEYDHIEGLLFTEKLKPLKRNLISRKLEQIKKGKTKADYRMLFANGTYN